MNDLPEPIYKDLSDRELLEILTNFLVEWDYNTVIEDDVADCLADPAENPDTMELLRTDLVVFKTALDAASERVKGES